MVTIELDITDCAISVWNDWEYVSCI